MKDLTRGKEGKLILLFALPMLLGNVFQILNTIIDSIIVGNFLGKSSVAAIGASFPVIFALISLIIGITSGITIIISQYFGAKNMDKVKHAVDTAYIFLFFASILVSIIGIYFCEDIFNMLNLPADVMPEAIRYMRIYLLGIIFMAGFNGTIAILRGLGDSKTPLYFLIIATILSIGIELLLIVYYKTGIEGAAYAALISQAIAFLIATFYLNKRNPYIRISFTKIYFDRDIFKKSLKIGLPSGFQQVFVAFGMVAILRIVNDFGTDTIAAYTIAGRIDSFASLPAMNFAMALMAFVGQNIGAGKFDRVKRGYKSSLKMMSVFSIVISIIVMFFSKSLMHVFNQDPEVIRIGSSYLLIVCSFYIMFSTMFVNAGIFRGAGDTLIPMFITLFSLWLIRIPVAYFLSRSIGVSGIWWSIPIAWFAGMVATIIYYRSGKWKNKAVVKHSKIADEFSEKLNI